MARTTIRIAAPAAFRLRPTVRSHGWSDLAPFATDGRGDALVIHLPGARAAVRQRGAVVEAEVAGTRRGVAEAVRSCLRMDLDLAPFWRLCRADPDLAWAARLRAGRFLRAPTVFADAAMTLATTNCSWALTRTIVRALVDRWGDGGAFPSQAALAAVPASDLRRHASLGYRAPYLAALARGPDLEPLRADRRPADELRKDLRRLPGFGPYAADNLLRLLGRYEEFGFDSAVLRKWRELHPRSRRPERGIERRFHRFGEWKGLALWLYLTREWHEREEWRI